MDETPSEDYPWVLVSENHPAFRDKEAAERYVKRQWASQQPGQRDGFFLARVKFYFEPDYDIDVHETPIDERRSRDGKKEEIKKEEIKMA